MLKHFHSIFHIQIIQDIVAFYRLFTMIFDVSMGLKIDINHRIDI